VTTADRALCGPVSRQRLLIRLDVPVGYLQRIHHNRTELFDANVNGLLYGREAKTRARDGAPGLGRPLLSDEFRRIDNLDVLMTILEAIGAAGIAADVRSADLTESRTPSAGRALCA